MEQGLLHQALQASAANSLVASLRQENDEDVSNQAYQYQAHMEEMMGKYRESLQRQMELGPKDFDKVPIGVKSFRARIPIPADLARIQRRKEELRRKLEQELGAGLMDSDRIGTSKCPL